MPALATPAGRLLLGPRAWPYLLLARFAGVQAAPLPATLPADVGTLAVTDTNGVMSQSGGLLVWNGTVAANDRVTDAAALARVAGRAFLVSVPLRTTMAANALRLGWFTTPATGASAVVLEYNLSTSVRIRGVGGGVVDAVTIGSAQHDFALVLRAAGGFALARNGASGPYTLLWVHTTPSTAAVEGIASQTLQAYVVGFDDARTVDLPAPWNSDYGIATARVPTTSAGSTVTAMPDAVIEHTITAATGVTQELHVRRQDATNKWIVRMDQGGSTIKLIELVANVETERDSKAQTWTNATQYRVVVTCEGATIKTYVADTAKNSYTSATSFQAATGVLVDTAGSDLVAWPRTLALPSGT